ncbi:MAG: hypothetical protein FVQ81_01900 [Candidatus Glassbacteria bacterium]|nr:hypothetical protein [Candidatus Glassbacteria bacterium]
MPTQCYYHSGDLDGKCSAAIVKRAIPDVELIPFDYGQVFPYPRYLADKTPQPEGGHDVFMVDVSLGIGDMEFLSGCCNLVWIDHHEPIIEAVRAKNLKIPGIQQVGKAACELCWQYLFGTLAPLAVRLLGSYDVWDFEGNSDVLPFQWGMRIDDWDPARNFDRWVSGPLQFGPQGVRFIKETIGRGETILQYQGQQNSELVDLCAFEGSFEGLPALVVNRAKANSQVFESKYDPANYKLMIAFYCRSDHKWVVSLYSTHKDVHCGEICKRYGGGGHKGAAGFVADKLPNIV